MSMMIHRHKKALAVEKTARIAKAEQNLQKKSKTLDYAENKNKYTRSKIMQMNTAELQSLASDEGIENALETTGRDLKEILINHFGL